MVARLQNVRKAAEAVHLTQPAVTLAIAKLETQADATLFDRRSRGTYLTASGEIFAARVDRMFAQIEEALEAARADRHGAESFAAIAERITRPQVRALATIANHGTDDDRVPISRASTYRAVRDLERLLGATLVEPSANGLSTNAAGAELARRLTIALQEIDLGIADIATERTRQGGRLRIGVMPLSGSFVVGPVLKDLTHSFPSAFIEIRTGDHGQMAGALMRGEIDLIVGLLRDDDPSEEVEHEKLVSLPYVLVAQPNHPLAHRDSLTHADLEGYDWVAPNQHTARRTTFDRLIANLKRTPSTNIQASSLSTVRLLLSGSNRLALLTRFEFEQEKGTGELIDLAFGPIEPAHWLGITRRANWEPTPLHRRFIDLVRIQTERIAASSARPARKLAAKPLTEPLKSTG